MSNYTLFYERRDPYIARYMIGQDSLEEAIRRAEELYYDGFEEIIIKQKVNTSKPKEIEKVVYRIFYKQDNIRRMTSLVTYSNREQEINKQIAEIMDMLGVKEYKVGKQTYNSIIRIHSRAANEKDKRFLKVTQSQITAIRKSQLEEMS